MIQRKKSLRDYSRDKKLREGKPLFTPSPATGLKCKGAVGRPSKPQEGSQPVRKPRAGLKRQSAKAKALVPARKACCELVRKRSGGYCEANIRPGCTHYGQDFHEILARSAGGSITDPENVMHLCRSCHEFTVQRANTAREMGLVAPRGA